MRGILEMQLIKLGELVDLPQQRRIQKLERELEELRQRQRARAEQVISSRVVADDAARQKEMNTRAYRACAAFWRRVAATAEVIGRIPTLAATPSRTSKLTRRLLNRPELRLLLVLEPEEIHRLPPGTFAAMGTWPRLSASHVQRKSSCCSSFFCSRQRAGVTAASVAKESAALAQSRGRMPQHVVRRHVALGGCRRDATDHGAEPVRHEQSGT